MTKVSTFLKTKGLYTLEKQKGKKMKTKASEEIHTNEVYGFLFGDDDILKYYSMGDNKVCLLYTSPSPRDLSTSRMPSSA